MIGGVEGNLGAAMKDMLAGLVAAIQRFFDSVNHFFSMVYYAIPREYVLAGLTILILGIVMMIYVSRPTRR